MAKLMVIQNDSVEGTDIHNITFNAVTAVGATTILPGTGSYDYIGKITDGLSDFVSIGDISVAVKSSQSSLNPGEQISPTGKHSGPAGLNFQPPSPPAGSTLVPLSQKITDPIGTGTPNTNAGSKFVTINNIAVLLDGDAIDTCDGANVPANSTVTAAGQDFVFCSE